MWNSATWVVGEALLPFVETVLGGPASWAENETIRRAIKIQDGHLANPAIAEFQNRSVDYPHPVIQPGGKIA